MPLKDIQIELFPEVCKEEKKGSDRSSERVGIRDAEYDYLQESRIEKLLVDHSLLREGGEEKVIRDIEELKTATREIKTIGKKSIILQGERIFRARLILKAYGKENGAFVQWLDKTFESRGSAYSMLHYYEFHQSLPSDFLRLIMRKMPLQAAYALSSKEGNMEIKIDLLKNYRGESQKDLLLLIQERFPCDKRKKKRKEANEKMIERIGKLWETLEKREETLSDKQRGKIRFFLEKFQALIED